MIGDEDRSERPNPSRLPGRVSPSAMGLGSGRSAPVGAAVRDTQDHSALELALTAWIDRGETAVLARWLDRELDPEGCPVRLAVPDWVPCLSLLARARSGREHGWPDRFDAQIEGFFRQTLRFSRPGGTAVFSRPGRVHATGSLFRYWADGLSDPSLATIVDWWFPSRASRHVAPPLPAEACRDRPLAMLRASWSSEGDFLAIDHRHPGTTSNLELFGKGRPWLGPTWDCALPPDPAGPSRPTLWVSNASADLLEWSFRAGASRVLRTALLLRGRRLALLADQVEGREPRAAMRVAVPEGVAAVPLAENRGVALSRGPGRPSARVFPVGLPSPVYPTERGAFAEEAGQLVLRQAVAGRRRWLPLLVSWEPLRNRKPVSWRLLTVSEKGKACAPETAVAVRVAWGGDEALVIYRSLGPPAIRAFLGHQTRARFLVGLFNHLGDVEPIFKVEE